jgi:hypothetical protein
MTSLVTLMSMSLPVTLGAELADRIYFRN